MGTEDILPEDLIKRIVKRKLEHWGRNFHTFVGFKLVRKLEIVAAFILQ